MMWSKFLSLFKSANAIAVEPPDSPDDSEFIATPNTVLRLASLNLTEDKVQRIFLDHAFRYIIHDYYLIMQIREKEMRDRNECMPEEMEQLKIEYQIIALILEHERKDFIYKCTANHLELLRKLAKRIIKLNPVIDKHKNPDLDVFWLENCSNLLKPFDDRLRTIKLKILYELIEAEILKEEEPSKSTDTGTATEPPPVLSKEDDIVMDGSDKTEEKKSTLNFN
ncbi:hypothetical protein [Pseudomonas fluorescens]|uniref:hypothetical protein n=1 Tax=Pseudomonas fluorescens TaxID=294 RepID=UPI0005ACD45D|nr:hypothetical protein [Pseudomonas fluorescens]